MANFNIYKASAGSGKTYTLVKEYIKKSLSSNNKVSHQSLLAITFTNKAASEMKTRIVDTLFQFSSGNENISDNTTLTLYYDLKGELNYSDSQIKRKSIKLLSDIIHYYSLFSVSTIDKFVHRIIRGFSYELDLSSNFEVEMETEKIIKEAVFELMDEIGDDHLLTKHLIKYSEYKIQEDKNWDIEEDLIDISKQLFKDDKRLFIDNIIDTKLIIEKQKELSLYIHVFEKKINSFYNEIKELTQEIPNQVFLYTFHLN